MAAASSGLVRWRAATRGAKPGTATTKKNIKVTRKNRKPRAPRIPEIRSASRSASFVGSSFESASLVAPVLRPSWARPCSSVPGEVLGLRGVRRKQVGELDQAHDAADRPSPAGSGTPRPGRSSVANQLGQPCLRAHRPIGSTAMVSTMASIVGAMIPAAAFMPMPAATTPRMPSSTMIERGIVVVRTARPLRGASPVGRLR